MDKLEKFIRENREEFDNKLPGDKSWDDIVNRMNRQKAKTIPITQWMWKAASIVLLAAVIGLLIERYVHDRNSVNAVPVNPRLTELKQVESYYSTLISEKREEIQAYLKKDPDFRKSFNHDINQLDSMYSQLKTELSKSYSEKIVDAMIVNLQLRIKILNEQLNILQSIQKAKKDEKSKV